MNKTAFAIFYAPDSGRHDNYVLLHEAMLKSFPELNTPTIYFKNDVELESFFKSTDMLISNRGHLGTGWKPGELGLWATTLVALKNFVKSDYDKLVIMEDDLLLKDNFVENLNIWVNDLPNDWGIFFIYAGDLDRKNALGKKQSLDIGKKYVVKNYQTSHTACYMITKSAANRVLELVKNVPVRSPIDTYLCFSTDIDIYCLNPEQERFASLTMALSTIQKDERKFYNI
jgi:GR25 family glycosyltransferase involved in LPS biosynthesis